MQFSTAPQLSKRGRLDALFLPFWIKGDQAKQAMPLAEFQQAASLAIKASGFSGKEGEILQIYPTDTKEKKVFLLGLGKEENLSVESLRKTYCEVTKVCIKKKIEKVNLLLPNIVELRGVTVEELLKGVGEGLLLANYKWDLATKRENKAVVKETCLIGILPKYLKVFEELNQTADGVYLARDLINGNADIVTPAYLSETATALGQKFPELKVTIFDQKMIEDIGLNLLLAVGRGAMHAPYFIQISYRGNPRSKDHTVLIGKGITFDTGGINLKPTGSIETMRDDMSGAATILGAMGAVAALGLKTNVTGIIPTCENAIGSKSFKPGDVYKSYLGKTVEITNTDAEGRLILADALAYAVKNLKPSRMINFATLTGAMVVALGEEMAGFFSNDEKLAKALHEASSKSNEFLWRLPLYDAYREKMSSDIADLKNSGGRPGGAILAALFLEEFVSKTAWAHIDIAGPSFASKENHYIPKNGVGFGVRLVIEFLRSLSS